MQMLLRWLISAGALYATVWLLSLFGQASVVARHWYSWFIAVIIMGLVNALIRPIARLLTAPLNCLTFGIIGVIVNGVMFWLVSVIMTALTGDPVFQVKPLGAIIGAILVGLIGGAASQLLIREDDRD
jgi:putative membrane protein